MLKSWLKVMPAGHNTTQIRLSQLTGIHPGAITNTVNHSIRQISVDVVCKICELFHCDIGDIFHLVPDNAENKD